MFYRDAFGMISLAAGLCMTACSAWAFDDGKYPDLSGQWIGVRPPQTGPAPEGFARGQPSFDPTKRWGSTQDAPLTPEYRVIFEANIADQRAGGQGTNATSTCLAPGMPMVMNAHSPMEIIVLPETTYILVDHVRETRRRIFTDGRSWPEEIEPSFDGYSIGQWVDTDGDGRYDVLEVETRGFKGPRSYDASGLPLHRDNESVINERIYLDKNNPNLLDDDITVHDHALTQPWTVHKTYRRNPNPQPIWIEYVCAEGQQLARIGNETYMLGGDGLLMPAKRGQAPPDLRYFKQSAPTP
jgi:hypothetical protein